MTIAERIRNIANKANVPYRVISDIVNSNYGNITSSVESKIKTLEEVYGIQ